MTMSNIVMCNYEATLAIALHSINEYFGLDLVSRRYDLDRVKTSIFIASGLIKNHKSDMKDAIKTIQKLMNDESCKYDKTMLMTAYRQPYIIYNNMKFAFRYLHAAYCLKKFNKSIEDLERKNEKSWPLYEDVVSYIANRLTPSSEYLARHNNTEKNV